MTTLKVLLEGLDGETISSFQMNQYESEYFLTENTPGDINKANNFIIDNLGSKSGNSVVIKSKRSI